MRNICFCYELYIGSSCFTR